LKWILIGLQCGTPRSWTLTSAAVYFGFRFFSSTGIAACARNSSGYFDIPICLSSLAFFVYEILGVFVNSNRDAEALYKWDDGKVAAGRR